MQKLSKNQLFIFKTQNGRLYSAFFICNKTQKKPHKMCGLIFSQKKNSLTRNSQPELRIHIRINRILLNKRTTRWYFITHEHRKYAVRFDGIVDTYAT